MSQVLKMIRMWSAEQLKGSAQQYYLYVFGILIFSLGAKCFIDSHLGTDPLDVLCIGMTRHLPITIGIASGIVAIVFLSVWSFWNKKIPPLTPFITTFAVGLLIDFWNHIQIEAMTAQLSSYAILGFGLLLCSFASALVIMSGIGIRIMDLVSITIIEKWGWSFFAAKMVLEVLMFAVGWALGGPVGIGTVGFLALVGTMIQPFMWVNNKFLSIPNYGLASSTDNTTVPYRNNLKMITNGG